MSSPPDVASLPAFVALDAHAVLAGERRGASLQLHDPYFEGRERALETLGDAEAVERHRRRVRQSRDLYDDVTIDFEELTTENLQEASARYGEILQRLPEVQFLQSWFPGTCFVLPEWLPKQTTVEYGARVYFFCEADAPDPADVLAENIDATVADDRAAFERYQGRLHGYPDCCIESFEQRAADGPSPEAQSVAPFADRVDPVAPDEAATASIEETVPGVFENPQVYAFFARGFFPEPDCDVARSKGLAIYDALAERVPESLVQDYFRFNVGWNCLLAAGTSAGESAPPAPGRLGREHRWFYLPLRTMLGAGKYQSTE